MTILGKYELLTHLGEGATSEVYRARDTALGRDVALKVLKPSLVADASAFERFAREAQAAAGLFHPNIATVLDMGEAEGRYFIAMRYFEGKALDKVLREDGPLTWDETLRLLAQVGSALDHAHKKGFLHRDVKPGNIIRDENGDFILTDFGLTRAMMSTGLTSHTGAVLGTPAYIAPEVWNGENAKPATDQYALACVLYECLTGQMLFDGDTPLALMKKVFDGPQLPADWPPGVPAGVGTVLQRALSAKPDERHPSLAAFEHACRVLGEKPAIILEEEKAPPSASEEKPAVEQAAPTRQPVVQQPASVEKTAVVQPAKKTSASWVWWVGGLAVLLLVVWFASRNDAGSDENLSMGQNVLSEESVATLETSLTEMPVSENLSQEISPQDGMTLLYVPAGEFTMGSEDYDDEKPVHTVTLDAFWIDQTEVTNAMFEKFVQATGWQTDAERSGQSWVFRPEMSSWESAAGAGWQHPQGPDSDLSGLADHPVVHVSWNDAAAYCEWAGRRLPTEPEWEKAARGTDGRTYPWGESWDLQRVPRANFSDKNDPSGPSDTNADDGYAYTAPVGTYPAGASPYGALDMAGNVWEWTASWYDAYPGNTESDSSYGTQYRVLRGGSWGDLGNSLRAAYRYGDRPDDAGDDFGFRCVRSP